jgi:hypothetical protein
MASATTAWLAVPGFDDDVRSLPLIRTFNDS